MSNLELPDKEIARIFRAKAARYIRMAEMLEAEGGGGMDLNALVSPRARSTESVFTADNIKQLIKTGNFRVGGLSNATGVSQEVIRAIIDDPSSGLTDEDRGWIREK